MKQDQFIQIELLSDTTFSRGTGTAGTVDVEVEHDDRGIPFLGGKTLRGLLRDSWLSMQSYFPTLKEAAERVFGPEADLEERSILCIGDAVVERSICEWIEVSETREHDPISPIEVLAALTDIRYQTSEDRKTGAPAETTLRSIRVIVRGLTLNAPLYWMDDPGADEYRCLAMSLLATRHAGLARNRGRGHIRLSLNGDLDETIRLVRGDV